MTEDDTIVKRDWQIIKKGKSSILMYAPGTQSEERFIFWNS
jgi:hypothetical protein